MLSKTNTFCSVLNMQLKINFKKPLTGVSPYLTSVFQIFFNIILLSSTMVIKTAKCLLAAREGCAEIY